ncbi:MAG: ABC transporter ATP-binding protein [Caldilineaceae bacterium]
MASIHLNAISVAFPIYDASARSMKKSLLPGMTGGRIGADETQVSVVKALEDVTLSIRHGDRIGLVGHNGAGKTTLLRVLAQIYEPGAGTVKIEGQIAPLFDISLGMESEATGYENIFLRGLFLGLSRAQIEERLDDIAAFTELGEFLNLPIRTYSAGMRMRLAFAVATSIDPDILLMDEGIGAGDASFLEKASKRLSEFTGRAGIIVLASHSEALVRTMCRTAVLMERGRVIAVGDTEEILQTYHQKRLQQN